MSSGEVVSFRKEWSKTFQYWGGRFPPSSILKEWSKTFQQNIRRKDNEKENPRSGRFGNHKDTTGFHPGVGRL